MMDFLRGDTGVLVSTTIIESGLDIPQANTLIVERADRLGLAQLYQIRGRVGRSRERAYAYLLYPSAEALTRRGGGAAGDAVRLHGARVRVQDRDARPGDPRCGQPARRRAVGSRGRGRLRALHADARGGRARPAAGDGGGEPTADDWEPVRLDVPVDAYVPADYIPYEVAKIDVHRRIAAAREPADLGAIVEELEDRFGPIPAPVENLVRLQEARIKLGRAGRAPSSSAQGGSSCTRSRSTPARPARCTRRSRVRCTSR